VIKGRFKHIGMIECPEKRTDNEPRRFGDTREGCMGKGWPFRKVYTSASLLGLLLDYFSNFCPFLLLLLLFALADMRHPSILLWRVRQTLYVIFARRILGFTM
jgi:hypothetical protein